MKMMTKREAAHRSAELWEAAAAAPVYILERGKPRYRVEAIAEFDPLAEYERLGQLTRASKNPLPIGPAVGAPVSTEEIAATLAEMRGDR